MKLTTTSDTDDVTYTLEHRGVTAKSIVSRQEIANRSPSAAEALKGLAVSIGQDLGKLIADVEEAAAKPTIAPKDVT